MGWPRIAVIALLAVNLGGCGRHDSRATVADRDVVELTAFVERFCDGKTGRMVFVNGNQAIFVLADQAECR